MRYLLLLGGLLLAALAGLKTYAAFHRADNAPEMMADATMAAIGAIVCLAVGAKLKKREVNR